MSKRIMPFDLFTALKIQVGITKGRFVTRLDQVVRIVCWTRAGNYPVVGIREDVADDVMTYTLSGEYRTGRTSPLDLLIELDEEDEK